MTDCQSCATLLERAEAAEAKLQTAEQERDESEVAFQAAHKELDETQAILGLVEQERDAWRAEALDWHNNATALEAANTALLAARDRIVEQIKEWLFTTESITETHDAWDMVKKWADELSTFGTVTLTHP